MYTIGQMAKKMGVAPSTLRYYDKEGLLPFVRRTDGGIRVFDDSDYAFLKIIHCLKITGMQIKDIQAFISLCIAGDETIDQRLDLFQKRREAVERQIAELQETLTIIDYKVWYYETAKAHNGTDYPENLPDVAIPENLRSARSKFLK